MTKTVVVATNNAHKADEIRAALDIEGWNFKTLDELGLVSNPEENAESFEGNARIKAIAAHQASGGLATLADDSGLMVDALDGAPGVYSSRYAGEYASDAENNAKLLHELANVAPADRTARFVCCLVFIDEDGHEIVSEGTVEGHIGFEARGKNGFGYDPLFYPSVFAGKKTFSEATQAQKTDLSHRGNALRLLKKRLACE